jgi:glycosyltransferase involved in cell wall biosynthesis
MKKRIWNINGRFLSQPQTGVQRYASEIVRALDVCLSQNRDLRDRIDLQILVPPDHQHSLKLDTITSQIVDGYTGHAWEQLTLPRAATGGLVSLCNTGPLTYRHQILCVHDANTWSAPASYSLPFRLLYRALQPKLCRQVRLVTTVSSFSAAELERFQIADPAQIVVVPNGHEHVLRWHPQHTPATSAASGPDTIVIVGSQAPHKNVGLLLGLADRLAEIGLRIAVVGGSDPRIFSGSDKGADAANVVWLGRIGDDSMAALLRDSLCLCFPSLTEGFGLPALEAMALGCPVISTDRASLPEVCGNAALYASPIDPGAWIEQLGRLKSNARLRAELVERGRNQARRFSWLASAQHYLQLMDVCDSAGALKATGEPISIPA